MRGENLIVRILIHPSTFLLLSSSLTQPHNGNRSDDSNHSTTCDMRPAALPLQPIQLTKRGSGAIRARFSRASPRTLSQQVAQRDIRAHPVRISIFQRKRIVIGGMFVTVFTSTAAARLFFHSPVQMNKTLKYVLHSHATVICVYRREVGNEKSVVEGRLGHV